MRQAGAMAAVLALAAAACAERTPPAKEFDGAQALAYVERQVAFGPRIPGTAGHAAQAAWMDSLLRTRADTVIVDRWTHVTVRGDSLPLVNILARFNPAATRRVLLLAHWDTRPRADAAGSRDTTAPVPGANDGGSGVAILLGVADVLERAPPAVGVDLLFVDGEDYGHFEKEKDDVLIGSRRYARTMGTREPPAFAILFDLVGDRDLQVYQEGNSLLGAAPVVERVWDVARRMGYGAQFPAQSKYTVTDDHVPLQQVGIPAIDLIDFDYPAWHTPDDTPDKVSSASLAAVGNVAVGVIREAATDR